MSNKMKKILLFIAAILLLSTTAQAMAIEGIYDETGEMYQLEKIEKKAEGYVDTSCYIFYIDDEAYFFSEKTYTSPIKYDERVWNFFVIQKGCLDYLWTGEYYYARTTADDRFPQSQKGGGHQLYLTDSELNIVGSMEFNQYPKEIAYVDGVYYVSLAESTYHENLPAKIMKSTDFKNWEEYDGDIPLILDNKHFIGSTVSFDGNTYYTIRYENEAIAQGYNGTGIVNNKFPLWNIMGSRYITNDNIYYAELPRYNNLGIVGSYFYDDKYVVKYASGSRTVFNAAEIEDALNEFKNSPYVLYNNEILAFDVSPVIEDGRTLIPIRFLFETMGATVEWDDETHSAIVSQDGNSVTVSVDDATAYVNGEAVTLDVPARLINGKTMVPVRFLSENLGYTVDWNDEMRIITVE